MLCQYHPATTECYTFTLEASSAESAELFRLLTSTVLNTVIKEKSAVPIDSSNFLWALKPNIPCNCSALFDFISQQNVAEFLQVVFDELKGASLRTGDLLFNTLRTTITCNSCFCSAVREEKLDIVSVPMAISIVPWRNLFHLSCWH